MIAIDSHILVYAHRSESPWYAPAADLLERIADSGDRWAIPWPCLYEFYNVVTNPRLYRPASTPGQALGQIDAWMESPNATLLAETQEHWPQLRSLLIGGKVVGPRVHDARIAALCLAHGVRQIGRAHV